MSEKLIIKILKDGTLKAETHGIKGKKRDEYATIIENIIPSKQKTLKHTIDYHKTPNKNTTRKNKAIQNGK